MKSALLLALGMILSVSAAHAKSTSEYTSLEDSNCKMLANSEDDKDAEIDYFSSVCKGRDGLDIDFSGGDSRSWISLIKAGTEPSEISTGDSMEGEKQGQFPNIAGKKLEWRYSNGNLNALIVRTHGLDPETNEGRYTLTIMRVDKKDQTKSCVLDVISAQQKNANAKARAIADSKLTCKMF